MSEALGASTRAEDGASGIVYAVGGDPGLHARASAVFDAAIAARYEVRREVATGGMGRILEAWDRQNERLVAIKVLLRSDATALVRFAREARITARLEHPAIVPLHEAGRLASGEPFYAMKLIRGRSLGEASAAATTPKERMALLPHFVALTEALAYAHDKRIVHRDLKPSNVLVGAFGETVVIDWGLAKDLTHTDDTSRDEDERTPPVRGSVAAARHGDGALTLDGVALGTPGYMAPEQARGEEVDERADVFAIGAMLRRLFVGRELRPGETRRKAEVGREGEDPASLGDDLPADFVAIVAKATSIDKRDRYASARELADDLQRFAAGRLVAAHTYSLGSLLGRWATRHRLTLAVAGALLLALVVLSAFGVRRIVRERDRADALKRSAEQERAVAVRERDAAEHLVQFAIGDLRDRLEPLGKLDLLAGLGGEVEAYYRTLDTSKEPLDPGALGRRASAIDVLAKVETKRQSFDVAEALRLQQRGIYERIVLAHPDDAEARAELALSVYAEARILGYGRGRYDESLEGFRRAGQIAAEAVARAPGEPRWRIVQAYVDASIAISLSDRSEYEASLQAMDRVRDEVTGVAADDAVDMKWRSLLAVVHCDLGNLATRVQRISDAVASKRTCVELRERIARSRPGNADDLLRLGEARRGVAYAEQIDGRVAEAAAVLDEAVVATRGLVARDIANLDARRELGMELSFLCEDRWKSGDLAGAEAACREGETLLRALAVARPDNVNAQRDFIHLLQIRGGLGMARADAASAFRAFDEATAVIDRLKAKEPDATKWQVFAANFGELLMAKAAAEASTGRWNAALADNRAAVELAPARLVNPDDVLTLARLRVMRADVARARGQSDAAERDYRQAAVDAEGVLPRLPQYSEPRKVLAEAWLGAAEVRARRGDGGEARALAGRALALLTDVEKSGALEPPRRSLVDRARALAK